ncbi:MAG: flavodoxin [Treponema sp.]|nr:flavodoxin [Treponema sp.]
MKTAVVYYSLDGNCALVADEIKSQLNADLIRLYTKDEKKRSMIGNLFWGGGMVFFKKKPPLKPYNFNPAAYDLVIFGAPVWAGSPAPPLNTLISETGVKGKKTAVFVCHGGGKGKALEKLKAILGENEIISETEFKDPIKDNIDEIRKKVEEWVKGFKG